MGSRGWHSLILLRHGESVGNREGIFTGLLDVPLTGPGRAEATRAGTLIREANIQPDIVFTSPMARARDTARIVVDSLPVSPELLVDWRLSERHYGALSGQSKADVLAEFGEEQFLTWRRSLHVAPPPHPQVVPSHDPTVDNPLSVYRDQLGSTESLHDVVLRVEQAYAEVIMPAVRGSDVVLVVAHGNSLRALCVLIDNLDEKEVRELNLPTGQPLLYEVDDAGDSRITGGTYLDPANAIAAAAKIAAEGGT